MDAMIEKSICEEPESFSKILIICGPRVGLVRITPECDGPKYMVAKPASSRHLLNGILPLHGMNHRSYVNDVQNDVHQTQSVIDKNTRERIY